MDSPSRFAAAAWRLAGRRIIRVCNDSTTPTSAFRPREDGNGFKREVIPLPGEAILPKRTNSAFIGTDQQEWLDASGLKVLVFAGVNTTIQSRLPSAWR